MIRSLLFFSFLTLISCVTAERAQNPIVFPSDKVFVGEVNITFSCLTPGCHIHYTTDGSDPVQTSPVAPPGYQLHFNTTGLHSVKAFSTADSYIDSDIVLKRFEIFHIFQPPLLSPASGTYLNSVNISASCPRNDFKFCLKIISNDSGNYKCTACPPVFTINQFGKTNISYYFSLDGIVISQIGYANYDISIPPYDVLDVNIDHLLPFQFKPKVDVFAVSKNLDVSSYSYNSCPKRNIRGHHIILHNPLGHFDILPPAGGCGKLVLPSETSKNFSINNKKSSFFSSTSYKSLVHKLSKSQITEWKKHFYETSDQNSGSCAVVTNAGFFNITSHACLGNLVSDGQILQTSTRHNVNFGIRDGKFVIGYITPMEILDEGNKFGKFDTLISGLVWLVRQGRPYVAESLAAKGKIIPGTSQIGNGEDMSAQSNGPNFANILSARTALGYDIAGRLMILQVEGESFIHGMNLYEFANYCIEMGFQSAINLDGGGSSTVTAFNELVSEPSWKCTADDDGEQQLEEEDDIALPINQNINNNRMCEKRVSSITCIHPIAPPDDSILMSEQIEHVKVTATPSVVAAIPIVDCTKINQYLPSSAPSIFVPLDFTTSPASLEYRLALYQVIAFTLALLLVFSLTVNGWYYITNLHRGTLSQVNSLELSKGNSRLELVSGQNNENFRVSDQQLLNSRRNQNRLDAEYGLPEEDDNENEDRQVNCSSDDEDETSPLKALNYKQHIIRKQEVYHGKKSGASRVFNPFSKRK